MEHKEEEYQRQKEVLSELYKHDFVYISQDIKSEHSYFYLERDSLHLTCSIGGLTQNPETLAFEPCISLYFEFAEIYWYRASVFDYREVEGVLQRVKDFFQSSFRKTMNRSFPRKKKNPK